MTDTGVIEMSRNLTCLQKLTHLSLDLSLYLLIELSLYSHFISSNVTDTGVIDMSKNLTCLQNLTHLSMDLRGYLLNEISLFNPFHSCNKITDNGKKSIRNNLKRPTLYIFSINFL